MSPHADRRCSHVWLDLPEPWCHADFVAAAEARKVAIASAEMFAVGRVEVLHAVRISLGSLRSGAELVRGLDVIAELIHSAPSPRRASI